MGNHYMENVYNGNGYHMMFKEYQNWICENVLKFFKIHNLNFGDVWKILVKSGRHNHYMGDVCHECGYHMQNSINFIR